MRVFLHDLLRFVMVRGSVDNYFLIMFLNLATSMLGMLFEHFICVFIRRCILSIHVDAANVSFFLSFFGVAEQYLLYNCYCDFYSYFEVSASASKADLYVTRYK